MLTHGHWSSVIGIGMWNHDLVKRQYPVQLEERATVQDHKSTESMLFGDKKKKNSQHMLVG